MRCFQRLGALLHAALQAPVCRGQLRLQPLVDASFLSKQAGSNDNQANDCGQSQPTQDHSAL